MRKLSMLVALGTIFSLALAVPALALVTTELGGGNNTYQEKACPPNGDETVNGNGGDDVLRLQVCGDLNSTAFPEDGDPATPECAAPCVNDSDIDIANGGNGRDRMRMDDGDVQDTATGGAGSNDKCVGNLDLGNGVGDIDDPPAGPGGGAGAEEDFGDHLDAASCETITWVTGNFYSSS
jgi:hypothetical protein